MTFIIHVNNKDYDVSDHAARRMLERFISEAMIIDTMQQGVFIEQPHSVDLYEAEVVDEAGEVRIIRVAVDEDAREVKSVMDDTYQE